MKLKKMHFINLSVNVFSTKVLIAVPSLVGNVKMIFTFPTRRLDRHFTWSSEPREGLAACSAKAVPSCSSLLP